MGSAHLLFADVGVSACVSLSWSVAARSWASSERLLSASSFLVLCLCNRRRGRWLFVTRMQLHASRLSSLGVFGVYLARLNEYCPNNMLGSSDVSGLVVGC